MTEHLTCGPLSFTVDAGALRHIRFGEVELIRAVSFLSRDRDWGTLVPQLREVHRNVGDTIELGYALSFVNGDARLEVDLRIKADPSGLTLTAHGQPHGAFETNRTGFTVLHPAHAAGCAARVVHSDDSAKETTFPTLIDPWQPMMDITELRHEDGRIAATCTFSGDTFEMEDQRQWGDASFKTYNRPLALPWPYVLRDAPLQQAVRLRFEPLAQAAPRAAVPAVPACVFPDTALVVTAAEAEGLTALPAPVQRLLCHVDTGGDTATQIAHFAALQRAVPDVVYDLELVCAFDAPPEAELQEVANLMTAQGFTPASTLVCPSVDRQSTPPGSDWPDCPPLTDIHAVAARLFAQNGGGMVSFFPELNRKRPPVDMLHFVSHGLCPIFHAADDLHVMETLETIPHITRSARAIIGDKGYRIGPCTIAMRQNPYGQRTIPNPDGQRITMAEDDPRHRHAFGAAYAIGLATALAPAGIEVWTPAAVSGPRGLHADWPITAAIATLAGLAGQPVHRAEISGGFAHLHVGQTQITANLTGQPQGDLPAYGWTQPPTRR
ncbi:hypothetical protein [Tropicibacter naphthalenivorans]|uniref:Uncharacterized protein n=1 Tax=Tropicibacter naphthalenivorans TaxID=441103 RepID=A0A0P1GF43_9RHOB|nr:hypothetical protein [Tropicibacter naphthalenivorans]CUH74934.1 hypothetical protein TRN7648_00159 [Tropicibacter naphthalenivorans]SMC47946.1 hypothetical protein SAMN04488093_101719 [Tropicibacter naphthalenivorans]